MPPFLSRKRTVSLDQKNTSEPSNKKTRTKKFPTNTLIPSTSDEICNVLEQNRYSEQSDENPHLNSTYGRKSFSSSDEFEDIPLKKEDSNLSETDEDDENLEFEDVETSVAPISSHVLPGGDLELTLIKDTRISVTNPLGIKKAPSKIERQIRVSTHKIHVQTLMWHNAIRNSWLCDEELQNMLLEQLPKSLVQQVEKWKQHSGITSENSTHPVSNSKARRARTKKDSIKNQRHWAQPAQQIDNNRINMSAGDPLYLLLRTLVKYWKQKFRINAPGLRKVGYMSLQRLDEELKSFNKGENDPITNGECFQNLNDFRTHAKDMKGSRDFGAQLFTALLRAIGLKTRMVASLQPIGFGWSQTEEAIDKDSWVIDGNKEKHTEIDSGLSWQGNLEGRGTNNNNTKDNNKITTKDKATRVSQNSKVRKTRRSIQNSSVGPSCDDRLDSSNSELSTPPSENESSPDNKVDKGNHAPVLSYDDDLKFPHYWSEVLSPVTNTYTPVDAIVTQIIASNRELVEKFEPRTTKADKMKQIIAYIVGHSSDGSAKELTTRYLKGKAWPGKTRGYRYPPEKIAIRDHSGKIKHQIQRDWFKTLMSLYERNGKEYPRDEIDDLEDITDLKPMKREKKEIDTGKETLKYYKTSPDFILERHLKREEALVLNAQHVKMFYTGKGDGSTMEKVFLRKDVVVCKSAETWHKEGRAPRAGEDPLKLVPYRAATMNRRRELAEAEYSSGKKSLQGLYSRAQTEWIIPPPIENGIIPKNSFGNIDLYVDSMLPEGAVHIPFRGMPRICKRLNLDYAEAVTGFEFGHRMAVPIITGVVVAKSNYDVIMEEWHKEEVDRARKEDEKRKKAALKMWKKMVMGLRVIKRFKEEYGETDGCTDFSNPFTNRRKKFLEDDDFITGKANSEQQDKCLEGGFLPEGFDFEEPAPCQSSGFFPIASQDDGEDNQENVDGFIFEDCNDILPREKPSLTKDKEINRKVDESGLDTVSNFGNRTRSKTTAKVSTKFKTNDEKEHQKLEIPIDLPKKRRSKAKAPNKGRDQSDDKTTLADDVTEILRRNPRRNTPRKASQAHRSHYFEHNDGK